MHPTAAVTHPPPSHAPRALCRVHHRPLSRPPLPLLALLSHAGCRRALSLVLRPPSCAQRQPRVPRCRRRAPGATVTRPPPSFALRPPSRAQHRPHAPHRYCHTPATLSSLVRSLSRPPPPSRAVSRPMPPCRAQCRRVVHNAAVSCTMPPSCTHHHPSALARCLTPTTAVSHLSPPSRTPRVPHSHPLASTAALSHRVLPRFSCPPPPLRSSQPLSCTCVKSVALCGRCLPLSRLRSHSRAPPALACPTATLSWRRFPTAAIMRSRPASRAVALPSRVLVPPSYAPAAPSWVIAGHCRSSRRHHTVVTCPLSPPRPLVIAMPCRAATPHPNATMLIPWHVHCPPSSHRRLAMLPCTLVTQPCCSTSAPHAPVTLPCAGANHTVP
ncbi:hypothetical protein DENSPDRAFT_885001 [Dentipellis sp. KUC8613]|nr:hypothetical protein DENSPDRAFT_885001 [Dentipellis sp. KUC8613]